MWSIIGPLMMDIDKYKMENHDDHIHSFLSAVSLMRDIQHELPSYIYLRENDADVSSVSPS